MWGPAPFSRVPVAERVRSVVVLLLGSMVAASRMVVLPRLPFRSPNMGGEAHFLAFLRLRAARLLLRVTGTPASECGSRS